MSGTGIYKWNNGNTFYGLFANGQRNGKGRYNLANGDWYEGEFANNVESG
jgi:hypothetical protein